MEKQNSNKNRELRLPQGFRFHPTDEELLVHYLRPKLTGLPLPASVITDTDIYKSDPWDLPGDSDSEERYFFSKREAKYTNGNRSNRSTGKPPNGTRTNWVLHEYRLLDSQQQQQQFYYEAKRNWVVCRVFLKKKSNKRKEEERDNLEEEKGNEDNNNKSVCRIFYDFMREEDEKKRRCCDLNMTPTCSCCSSSSSSSCSSSLTHTFSNDYDDYHYEEISCRDNKFCVFL
ncbi:unnamed protein product [Cochlearia groenlandica]